MHLFEARSVRMDEIFDNHAGELGRPTCNIEKEELIDFLISNIAGQRLYQHLVFQKEHWDEEERSLEWLYQTLHDLEKYTLKSVVMTLT